MGFSKFNILNMMSTSSMKKRSREDTASREDDVVEIRVEEAASPKDGLDDEQLPILEMSDTELCFHSIVNRIPNSTESLKGALSTQIESLCYSKIDYLESMQQMRFSSKYRVLACSYAGIDSDLIMELDYYLSSMKDRLSARLDLWYIYELFSEFLSQCCKICVLHSDIMAFEITSDYISTSSRSSISQQRASSSSSSASLSASLSASSSSSSTAINVSHAKKVRFSEKDIQILMSLGYLRPRRDTDASDVYWFAHPQMGMMVNHVLEARKSILSIIRQKQYKEIYVSELKSKCGQTSGSETTASNGNPAALILENGGVGFSSSKFMRTNTPLIAASVRRGSCLKTLQCTQAQGIDFHILDLCGAGLIKKVPSPRGDILRLKS